MGSGALSGTHYCEDHQGNDSHYDKRNCVVCTLEAKLMGAKALLRGVVDLLGDDAWNWPDLDHNQQAEVMCIAQFLAAQKDESHE